MKLKLLSQQFTVLKSATVILMLVLLSTTSAFAQCDYAGGNAVGTYTPCVGNNINTATVNTDQHVVINVVKGFTYTFSVGNVFFFSDNYEKLTLFNGADNSLLTNASGVRGTSIPNWTATFSGTVKLQLNRGTANNCVVGGNGSSQLTIIVIGTGNTQDDPTTYGTDQWIGHVYNWTGAVPPGGTSPTTLSTATNPFTAANYVGYYTIPTETIDEGFGGDYACFPIFSNGVNRVNIYTETFAVRYRMRSTKTGSYLLNLTGDDGVRVYVDGKLVFDAWREQSSFTYCNNLIYLSGNNEIVLDYYENRVNNVLKFSLTAFDPSTNAVTGPGVRNVCSNVSPGVLDGSSYDRCTVSTYANISFQWQVSTDNVNFSNIEGATAEDYTVPAVNTTTNNVRYYRRIVSQTVSNSSQPVLSSNVIRVNTSANSLGTTGAISGTASLCFPASSQVYSIPAVTNALNYLWSVPAGWTITSGQGTTSITVTPGTSGQNGNISVVASNGCRTNAAQTLAVNVNPVPTSVTATASLTSICLGGTVNLSVSNNAPATYSWTSNPPGFTSTLQNPTGVAPTVNTTYTVTVTNAAGCSATATTAEVTVNPNTSIATQPAVTTTYCQNAAATALSVSATGTALSYQWYSNTANSNSGGTLIGGATSASYTPSTTVIGTRYYYAVVTGSCGTATSNTAAVIVNQNTAVTTQPAVSTSYCQNAAATALTVAATGNGSLSYQWYTNSTNSNTGGSVIGGATSASYTPSTVATGTIYYYAVVTGPCGTATSNIATVTVNSLPTATVLPSAIAPVCQNGTASFNLTGTPGATVTYNLNGGTSQTVVLDGSGVASVTVNSVAVNQTLNIVSVFDGTCTNPATSSATVVVGKHTVYNGSGWTITPTATNNLSAEIRAAYSSSGTSLNVCSLLVTNNAPVVISTGDSFTIRNGIQVDAGSSLTVSSDANLIQINDAAVNTGNITLKRDSKMKRLDYIYWGTPVEGQTLKTFSPNTVANRFYSYKEIDDTFSVITPLTNPMVKGQGYVIRAPNNFTTALQTWPATFTGKPHNGIVDVAVTKLGAGKNLVGNPYPSNINLDQLTLDNPATANGVYYFWTNINDWVNNNTPTPNGESGNYEDNNYALYNATGGVPSAGNTQKPSGIVKPGQGFLYEARAAGNLRFKNNVRTNEVTDRWGTASVFISNKTAGAKTAPSAERYWLKLTNPAGQFNTLLLAYIEGATNSFEPRFDAKFPVESSDQFYSLSDGANLIIQGRGYPFTSDDVVPLGMKGFETGTYTMSLQEKEGIFANGQNIYLKDKQTGIITNLSQGSYAFAASAGVSNGRFEIIYEPQTVLAADGSVKETIMVYRDGSDYVIKSSGKKITGVEVYDTSGKLISGSAVNQTEVRIDGTHWVNSVYILKINRNGEIITRKILR